MEGGLGVERCNMWELFSEFSAQSFCKPKTAQKKKKKYSLIVKKTKNKKESSTCPCSKTPFLFCLNRHWLASYYQSQGASFHLPSIQSVQRPETKKTYLNSKPGGNNWQGLGKQLARTRKQQEPRNHPVLPSPTQSPGGPSLHRP